MLIIQGQECGKRISVSNLLPFFIIAVCDVVVMLEYQITLNQDIQKSFQ